MKYLKLISTITAVLSTFNTQSTKASEAGSQYRPQFHFSPKKNWMNDPNGLVYYKGEYHLFFQYNPEGTQWGHMSWGHAVSKDLLHWQELPVAIPEDDKHFIFSGSAVIDEKNTSGFGTVENPPMVAIYTSSTKGNPMRQTQSIAYSLDAGRTFTKYANNPVIDSDLEHFRDPKVFWDQKRNRWVMILVKSEERKAIIYSSTDLKKWNQESEFGPAGTFEGIWECPDLFELSIDGESKWVLIISVNPGGPYGGSGAQYFIGDFDGKTFIPTQDPKQVNWLDYGQDNYAAVTYNNTPDNRRILIGWMNNWRYASVLKQTPWTGSMTIPHELSLIKHEGIIKLVHTPIKELVKLRSKKILSYSKINISGELPLKKLNGNQLEISFTLTPGKSRKAGIKVLQSNDEVTEIGYDKDQQVVYVDRSATSLTETNAELSGVQNFPTELINGKITLRIIIDRSSVEVFVNGGQGVISDLAMPDNKKSVSTSLFAIGGQATISNFEAFTLKSAR